MPSGVEVQVLSPVPDELMRKTSLWGRFFSCRAKVFIELMVL
jgi:hypothetical protein